MSGACGEGEASVSVVTTGPDLLVRRGLFLLDMFFVLAATVSVTIPPNPHTL